MNTENDSNVLFGQGLMTWLTVAFAVYFLFAAVTGKGGLYKNDYIKQSMVAAYRRITRIFALEAGLLCAAMAVLDWLSIGGTLTSWILIGAVLVSVVVFVIITRPMLESKGGK